MKLYSALLPILILIAGSAAFATGTQSTCTAVDHSEKFGPPHYQQIGNCVANAAGDLITAHLGLKNDPVSILDVTTNFLFTNGAINADQAAYLAKLAGKTKAEQREAYENLIETAKFQEFQKDFDRGEKFEDRSLRSIDYVITAYNFAGGACRESRLRSDPLETPAPNSPKYAAVFIQNLISRAQRFLDKNGSEPALITAARVHQQRLTALKVRAGEPCPKTISPFADLNNLQAFGDNLEQVVGEMVRGQTNRICSPRSRIPLLVPHSRSRGDGRSKTMLSTTISELLKTRPVGIGMFQPCFLLNSERKAKAIKSGGCGHAAIIVGRKVINGQCLYKMRNSWGTDCSVYPDKLKNRCDGKGNVFLTLEEVEKNVDTATWL